MDTVPLKGREIRCLRVSDLRALIRSKLVIYMLRVRGLFDDSDMIVGHREHSEWHNSPRR